jgi:dihydroorotase
MLLIKNGHIIDPESGLDADKDMLVQDGKIVEIGDAGKLDITGVTETIDAAGCIVAPGLVDGHVHFRDPGQTYKEDILTGGAAAAKGGFTSVVMMGNTVPTMDNPETIKYAIEKGKQTGIKVYACGNVTMGMEGKVLTDMDALLDAGAVLFTDDGKPITNEENMRIACKKAKELGKVISLHEEDPQYIINNGVNSDVAARMGLVGSPRIAEISMVDRDIKLAIETGADIVIQHISAGESVELIRQARKTHKNIHAEATPHHFTLTDEAVLKHGTLAKMNPPLRLESDRMAIIEGLKDGTIEMIATDHAPHSEEEKAKDLKSAPSGIIGLETSLSLGIRELVQPGYMTMSQMLWHMTVGVASVYDLDAGRIKVGGAADIVIFDPNATWVAGDYASKATNTPFTGETMPGVVRYTICDGKVVYKG